MNTLKTWAKPLAVVGSATLALILLFLGPDLAQATSHDVNAGDSIQAAIDNASPGDTVRVAQGTFTESLLITKSLTLLGGYTDFGAGSRTPRTTLLQPSGRGIEIAGAGIEVTVDGFEIGRADAGLGNGGGILVDVEDDSSITINDNRIVENTATEGGGIHADVDNRSDLHITDNEVGGNTSDLSYAGIYADVRLSSTLVISDNLVLWNVSGDDCGGLYAHVENLSRFQIEGNQIEDNRSATDGSPTPPYHHCGGLYLKAEDNCHGTFSRNGVIGNSTDDNFGGGYVFMESNSSTTFYDNVFRSNTTNYGNFGGLFLYAYGNSQVIGASLVVEDNAARGAKSDLGGAYVHAAHNSLIALPNSRITGNSATGDEGGARFYAYDHSTIRVPDLYVYDNVAGDNYGGVYLDAADGNDTIIATGATVISNTAQTGDGGGGYVDLVDGSSVDLTGSRFERNTASRNGGGLYVSDIYGVAELRLGQSEFIMNTAGTDGGGIHFSCGPNYGAYLELTHASFTGNIAQTGRGGGFFIGQIYYNSPTNVSIQADHMTFDNNRADEQGGGFYINDAYNGPGQMVFDDGVYRHNTAGTYGGGLYWQHCTQGCDLSMDRNHFENNEATVNDGGGLYFYEIHSGSETHVDDNVFLNNTAGNSGGGLYWHYCTEGCGLSISRNRFEENEATSSDGGGLYVYEAYYSSDVHVDDNVFLNNTAGRNGGAFYNDEFAYKGATGTFDRNELHGNTAGGAGGGFYSYGFGYDGADVSFSDNRVTNNVSHGDGGGVFMEYPAYYGLLTFEGNEITNNMAIDGNGGGLYFSEFEYGSRVEFKDNVINANTISGTGTYNGGGVYIYTIDEGSTVEMTGNQINVNVATGDGGGLFFDDYIDYGSVWIFEDNELRSNWAGDDGGGCYFEDYWYDGAVVRFNRNRINGNTAIGEYGGCYFYDIQYAEVDLIGNEFIYNTAGGNSGGLYFKAVYDGAVVRFWDNQVIGNRAGITDTVRVNGQIISAPARVLGGNGGGLHLQTVRDGGEVDFRRNQIRDNTAYANGSVGGSDAGLYVDLSGTTASSNGGLLTMIDNTIAENEAQHSFGGLHAEMANGARLVMEHNTIRANTAITEGGGIYVYGEDDDQALLRRNQIVDNNAPAKAGMWLKNGDDVGPLWTVSENNLIAGNQNGGLYLQDASFWSTNDTIADNASYGVMMTGTVTSTAHFSNTIIWGHASSFTRTPVITATDRFTMCASYSDIEGGWTGSGNIDQYPAFVGGGDYHLRQYSPARDAAQTSAAPTVDLDGVPRPVPAGGEADMGAYEWRLPGVNLTPNRSITPDPGTHAVLTHTVENIGNAQDTFSVNAISANGWSVQVAPTQVTLPAGGSSVVTMTLEVPTGQPAGATDTINVSVASVPNPAVVDGVQDHVTVALVPALTFTPDGEGGALPGTMAVYEHILTNDGNGTDIFHLSASSSLGWSVSIKPHALTLASGSSAAVRAYVTVASSAVEGATEDTTITATSVSDGTVTASVTDRTTAYGWPYSLFLPLVNRSR